MKNIKTFETFNLKSVKNKLKCKIDGHVWSDDETKPEIWRKKSGWKSTGGFPECEERTCIVCGKKETK